MLIYYTWNSFLSIILIFFVVGFDNEQVSIQVNGGGNGTTLCCWGVYSETAFQGEVLYVRYDAHNKGIYNSAQDMGKLFKDAISIQLLDKNCGVPYWMLTEAIFETHILIPSFVFRNI